MQEVRLNKTTRQHRELKRFLRYLLVGLSGTLLDFALLAVFKHFVLLPTLSANVTSYSCGIINNFLLSRYWVYREAPKEQTTTQFVKFVLVSLVGLALNNLIVLGLEGPAGQLLHNASYGYIPAKIIATGVGLFWNYLANRVWTFGEVK